MTATMLNGLSGSTIVSTELVDDPVSLRPRVTPEPVAPVTRLRSPLMEHREIQPILPAEERTIVVLPPLRAFVGPLRFGLLVATPFLLLTTLQVALLVTLLAPVARAIRNRADGATFTLGDGFLPYRADDGWPHGVQEDNDIHWNWSPTGAGGVAPVGGYPSRRLA